MIGEMMENVRAVGPVFAAVWLLTLLCTVFRPQRYLNSILLMLSLMVSAVFAAGFLGREAGAVFLLVCFLLVMLALFLVPVLLILNGVQMLRKESFCLAHALSLGLGIFVAIGEIATVVFVLGLSGYADIAAASLWFLLVAMTVFYFSCLVLSFVLYSVFMQIMPHRMNFDYVIIHGCGLSGGERVTKLLSNRLDRAIGIWRKCGGRPFLIPSGGQGSDEKLSEAEAMKQYLIDHGIPEEKILPEDASATTRENLLNSKVIIDARGGGKKTALVSSNYHVFRCLRIARKVGLKCTGIGADVALYFWPSALIREFIAVFTEKGFLIPALLGYLAFVGPVLIGLIG